MRQLAHANKMRWNGGCREDVGWGWGMASQLQLIVVKWKCTGWTRNLDFFKKKTLKNVSNSFDYKNILC